MIILHDEMGCDPSKCQAMGDVEEGLALLDYVLIEAPGGDRWVGQVVQPNRNISTVSSRLDPVILHGLRLMQEHSDVQSVRWVPVWEILLLGQYEADAVTTARVRPLPGAMVTALSEADTRNVLQIPTLTRHTDGSSNVIGLLINAKGVPLCLTPLLLNHHLMVVGGTGAGKSNVNANVAEQATRFGKCLLIHDAKPDYGFMGKANTDERVSTIWPHFAPYGLAPRAAHNLHRIGFYRECDPASVDQVVGFRASDFSPDMLSGVFFTGNDPVEQNSFDAFRGAADAVRREREGTYGEYSLEDILNEVKRRGAPNNPDIAEEDVIHQLTKTRILRKVEVRRKALPWLDAVGRPAHRARAGFRESSVLDGPGDLVQPLDLPSLIRPGRTLLIDYSRMDEASYALLLSYFLQQCHDYCRRRTGTGIVQLVDEAHRIFDNDTRHSGRLGAAFARVMREGRSLDHSIVLSLQNALQIPPNVMGNLNSRIVMRQNSREQALAAAQTMGRDFVDQSLQLGTGHALVSLFESRAVVLAQMAPSPFELQRTDNSGRGRDL